MTSNSPGFKITASLVRALAKGEQGHKYDYGHALVLSGGVGKGGAARLAARGALRIGAGVVTVGCPPAAVLENAVALDAVMVRAVKDAHAVTQILANDPRINAVCIGPGFGLGDRQGEILDAVLQSGRAVMVDADAITLLAQRGDLLTLHERVVVSPHAGEFLRLFGDLSALDKISATIKAAQTSGAVVCHKGATTVVADPKGDVSHHYTQGSAWLATAGSGDVLAGFITGLLARGFAPTQATQVAVYLHSACAKSFGAGLIAEDLPEELPKVFQQLGV